MVFTSTFIVGSRESLSDLSKISGDSNRSDQLEVILLFHLERQGRGSIADQLTSLQHVRTVGSQLGVQLQAQLYHVHQVFRILGRKGRDAALAHTLKEHIHVVRAERGLKGNHFVEDAAQTPNVALVVIGLVLPDFRAGVVWSSRLSL